MLVMDESCFGLERMIWPVLYTGSLIVNSNINLLCVFPAACPPLSVPLSTPTLSPTPTRCSSLFRSLKSLGGFFQFVVLGVGANPPKQTRMLMKFRTCRVLSSSMHFHRIVIY